MSNFKVLVIIRIREMEMGIKDMEHVFHTSSIHSPWNFEYISN